MYFDSTVMYLLPQGSKMSSQWLTDTQKLWRKTSEENALPFSEF